MNFDGESIEDGKYKKITETSVTNTEAIMNSIMVLEAELTKVQRAKTKAIETLSKYRLEKAKLERTHWKVRVLEMMLLTIGLQRF